MRTEAAVTTASITAGVTALLALITAFGLPVTPEQQAAILGVVAVVGPLVVGFVARRFVWSQASVEAKLAAQAAAGTDLGEPDGSTEVR